MVEATLFDRPKEILVTDPNTRDKDDDRLSGQNLIIYEYLLLHGTATNVELVNISKSMNLTARISDIRRYLEPQGFTIKCTYGVGGVNNYSIMKGEKDESS